MDTINIECKKFVEQNFKIQTCSEFFQCIYKLQTKSKWCKKMIVILYSLLIRKLIKISQILEFIKFERSPIFWHFFKIQNVLLCNSVIMMLLLSDLGKSFATLFPRAKDVQN